MTKIQDVIRAALPSATDTDCEYVLWNRTAYPFKKLTARDIYKAASRTRRAGANGIQLCDHCDNRADDGWECKPCRDGRMACADNT